jgi:hypothetical protein
MFTLWQLLQNSRNIPHIWLLYSMDKFKNKFWQKMGWATFWAIFHKLIWSPWMAFLLEQQQQYQFYSIKHNTIWPP